MAHNRQSSSAKCNVGGKIEKMMNVLHVGKYYPPDLGGIESVTQTLVTGLRDSGINADVLCFAKGARTRIDMHDGASIVRAGTIATLSSQPISLSFFWHFLRLVKCYDLVHLHVPNPLGSLIALLLPKGKKLVVHWHSDIIRQKLLLKLFTPIQSLMLKRADAIIVTSPAYLQGSVTLRKFSAKVVAIPIGIKPDSSVISDAEVEAIRSRFSGKYLVFSLGRLIYYKGFEYLIEAARLLPDKYVIAIGGVGEMRESLQALINDHGLQKKVFLVGRISSTELPAYYEACNVFCLPSVEKSEAFGVVLLEAMSYGRPIVATKIFGSGVPWVNCEGVSGTNVQVRDPAALASALREICENQELANKYGQGALNRFHDVFTDSIFLTNIVSLYRQIIRHEDTTT